jgi:hypothetical protein
MAVRIRSLATSAPVVVPLSTGEAVRLSPGQVSRDMPQVMVTNNAKVEKLRQLGLIEVEAVAEQEASAGSAVAPGGPGDQSAAASGDQPPNQPEPAPDAGAGRTRPSRLIEPSG